VKQKAPAKEKLRKSFGKRKVKQKPLEKEK
jgi:hypothetical protein